MTDTFHLTPSESVRVVRHDPDALEVEGTWGPGGSAPPKQFHPAHDEPNEVLEGTLKTRVDGEERDGHRRDQEGDDGQQPVLQLGHVLRKGGSVCPRTR